MKDRSALILKLHLVSKLKGIHLRQHEVGQEPLVLLREVSKVRRVLGADLEKKI